MRARPSTEEITARRRSSWGQRYVGISLILFGLCLPAIWFYSGYHQISFNELLSFRIDDGWCAKGVQSIGQHCFGDYAGVDAGLRAKNFWTPGLSTATAYPPLSLLPTIAFVYLGRAAGSWALGRNLFLALLAGSMLSPAVWVSRRGWADRGPVSVLIIGVASAPFLIILDRGNTAGLLVAPLLGLATAYVNAQHRRMLVFIVICTLLKPQMLLLALLFIVYRKYWHLVATAAISGSLTFAAFLFFPGPLLDNIRNWLHAARGYQTFQQFSAPYPYNLGAGRSILTIFDFSHLESLTGASTRADLASWLQKHASLLSVFLIVVTVAMIYIRKHDSNLLYPLLAVCILIAIAPGTSFSYYLVLFLVPIAFVLRDPHLDRRGHRPDLQWPGILDRERVDTSRWDRLSRWVLIGGLALLLAPLAIPITFVPLFDSQLHAPEEVGVLQMLWGPILIVLFVLVTCMALLPPTRRRASSSEEPTREIPGATTGTSLQTPVTDPAPADA